MHVALFLGQKLGVLLPNTTTLQHPLLVRLALATAYTERLVLSILIPEICINLL